MCVGGGGGGGGWVNNGEAGDLRRHRAHYDVSVWLRVFYQVWSARDFFMGDVSD